jgi:hypothetical protein
MSKVPDRYFFDTEFNEKVPEPFGVDFISIGIVAEDGREYYAVNRDFNRAAAQANKWVANDVLPKLPPETEWQDVAAIRAGVLALIKPAKTIELWAKNASYDNFVLCRLFGGMMDMRACLKAEKGIEKVFFRDSNNLREAMGNPALPEQDPATKHDAIADARQERREFLYMQGLKPR